MNDLRMTTALRDAVIGILVLVVGTAILAFAGIPGRVLVIESSQVKIERTMERMDSKIDMLLERRSK